MPDRFYITTPIYYVNDVPHIGHAYTSLACDVLARFMRLDGKEVFFLTGTDEHGQKVEKSARAKGMEPQAFCDGVSAEFRRLTGAMGFSNDDFIRTTEPRHYAASQAIWARLQENGHIYKGSYAGWYSVRDEAFYAESELVDGKAPTGAEVEWVEEPSYFFRLSAFQDRLLEFYQSCPEFIYPDSRRNEVMRFVEGGLEDLSVSRTTFRWGVPVPGDPDHVMYVWLDALTNYLTAAGYPDERYQEWWPALHMVGKDILRFHAVYWPAFLMGAGIVPPQRVVAHGWWTNEGQKISKSLGNVIDPFALVEEYGLDATRYFLMREVPFGQDGDFAHDRLIRRINAELANNIGNLAQRSLTMIQKHCGAAVPSWEQKIREDEELLAESYTLIHSIRTRFIGRDIQRYDEALKAIMELGGQANEYIDRQAPWTLRKTDTARMEAVLYTLAETLRVLGLLLQPFIPATAAKMLDQLAVSESARSFAALTPEHALKPGTPLPAPEPVMPRFVEKAVDAAKAG